MVLVCGARSSHGFRIATWYLPAPFFQLPMTIDAHAPKSRKPDAGFTGSPDQLFDAISDSAAVADATRLNFERHGINGVSKTVLDAAAGWELRRSSPIRAPNSG